MKKLFLSATAIATVMSASAIAADLPSIKSAPVSPTPLWTGFYAGLNAGYGFGTANNAQNYGWANPNAFYNNVSAAAFAGANSYMGRNITQGGFIGGGQAGYNYQYGKNFVLGFETDIQGAGIGGEGSATGVAPYQSQELYGFNSPIQAGVNWMGTARGRIGYLVAPSVLLYATGGLAYGGTYLKTFPSSLKVEQSIYLVAQPVGISTQNAQQNFNVGWTAGGGAEWMMAPNWSIKGEALYYDLGNTSVSNLIYMPLATLAANNPMGGSTTRSYYQGVIARAGINYHFDFSGTLVSKASFLALSNSAFAADLTSIKSAPVLAPAPMWTGFYAGLNAGYGFGTANNAQNYGWANPNAFYNNVSAAAFAGANSYMGRNITQGGFIGGGQAGYNYQYGKNFVLGFETDIQGAGIGGEGSATGVAPYQSQELYGFNSPIQAGVNWMGTARGRIGYLVAPSVLLYATGGLAYGGTYLKTFPSSLKVEQSIYLVAQPVGISTQNAQQNFNVGWTAGGGAEWMMAPNWSIKGEALYYDLGNTSVSNVVFYPQDYAAASNPSGGSTTRAYYQGIIARAGVNYHFNFVSAPVVAKF